ncbi:MAG: hypothetical protein WCH34_08400 [Bacteroidota bacterium]
MKTKTLLIAAFLGIYAFSFSQQSPNFEKWNSLIGTWIGDGNGKPGQGVGSFTFSLDLDKNILIRKSHTLIFATKDKKEAVHDDLMIIYGDSSGFPARAIYFDNEQHVINYNIDYSNGNIILTSEKKTGVPQFRLTYSFLDKETLHAKFDISPTGDSFFTYIEGNSKRKQ